MDKAYNKISFRISKLVTQYYSTSFSLAVSLLKPETRKAIYAIYGFVRFADEIVDSFRGYDQSALLDKFESDYYHAYKYGISSNPILHSFQDVVKEYKIPDELVQSFLKSMKMDLHKKEYSSEVEMNEYVNGSANVVGLMCLMVFVDGDMKAYNRLKIPAQKLGSAFQKVNFLRDLKCDTEVLNRQYFPDIVADSFNKNTKAKIIDDIENDFAVAYEGIVLLPPNARLAVMIAYSYYRRLLQKIRHAGVEEIMNSRIRISNLSKILLLTKAMTLNKLKLI
jgi:15-cis-phytoene synthase